MHAGSFGSDRISRAVYDTAGQVTQLRAAMSTTEEAAEVTTGYASNGRTAPVAGTHALPLTHQRALGRATRTTSSSAATMQRPTSPAIAFVTGR